MIMAFIAVLVMLWAIIGGVVWLMFYFDNLLPIKNRDKAKLLSIIAGPIYWAARGCDIGYVKLKAYMLEED